MEHARRIGLEVLTLYSFSNENWKRPKEEVEALMELCRQHLVSERPRLLANDIRLRRIGRDEGMPASVLEEIRRTEEATAGCFGMTLVLAINYGGARAGRRSTLAGRCAAGSPRPTRSTSPRSTRRSTPGPPGSRPAHQDRGGTPDLELPVVAGLLRGVPGARPDLAGIRRALAQCRHRGLRGTHPAVRWGPPGRGSRRGRPAGGW